MYRSQLAVLTPCATSISTLLARDVEGLIDYVTPLCGGGVT